MPTTCDYALHGDNDEAVSKVHFWIFSSHATNCRMMPSEGTGQKEHQARPATLARLTTSGVRSTLQKKVVVHIIVGKVERGAGQDFPRQIQDGGCDGFRAILQEALAKEGLQVIHVDMKDVGANFCF